MNPQLVRKLGFYALGAIAGGLVGAGIATLVIKRIEAHQREMGEATIEGLENLIDPEIPEEGVQESEMTGPDVPYETLSGSVVNLPADKPVSTRKGRSKKEEPVDYTAYTKGSAKKKVARSGIVNAEETVAESIEKAAKTYLGKSSLQTEETVSEEGDLAEESYIAQERDLPYVLSLYDYVDPENQNEKKNLTYYETDDIVAEADDTVVADPDTILGGEALVNFGKGSNDPDVVYIRDPKNKIDYEVVRVKRSYQQTVLGVAEEKPAKKSKKVRKADAED